MAAGFSSFAKTILAPLIIAFSLYLLLFHVLIPLYRRHRARYSNYEPLLQPSIVSRISQYTPSFISSIWTRLSNSLLFHLFSPLSWVSRSSSSATTSTLNWRYNPEAARHGVNPFVPRSSDSEDLFDEEEGEGMVGFNVQPRGAQPEDLERYAHAAEAEDSGRRLSRELEEGFRDDSDDEDGRGGRRTA